MRTAHYTMLGCLAVIALLLAGATAACGGAEALPPAVADAIEGVFPDATVRSSERETENGVPYYEINLMLNGNKIEVEVDEYGGIGEIERHVEIGALPKRLARAIAQVMKDGGRSRIERHERWGIARGDRFVSLDRPRVCYEIDLYIGEGRLNAKWTPSEDLELPEKVAAAIKAAFPGAVTVDVEEEDEDGVRLYEVALLQAGRDMEVEVSPDGVLVEVETEASLKHLPRAVLNAIEKAAEGSSVRRVERTEIRAVVKDGKFTLLDRAKVVYEAELRKGDQKAEVEVAGDGTILEKPEWKKAQERDDDDEEDDEGDDDDDNDGEDDDEEDDD